MLSEMRYALFLILPLYLCIFWRVTSYERILELELEQEEQEREVMPMAVIGDHPINDG